MSLSINNMGEVNRFKIDSLIVQQTVENYLFLVNINLPQAGIYDGSLDRLLETVQNCVGDEFSNEIDRGGIVYAISATFQLTHSMTGQSRPWRGNYHPRGNDMNYLRTFTRYRPETFTNEVRTATNPAFINNKLAVAKEDTKWNFAGLESVVLNFQALCDRTTHPLRPGLIIPPANIRRLLPDNAQHFTRYLD